MSHFQHLTINDCEITRKLKRALSAISREIKQY